MSEEEMLGRILEELAMIRELLTTVAGLLALRD